MRKDRKAAIKEPIKDVIPAEKPVLITSLEELSFYNFILCAVGGEYNFLTISGTPTKDDLYLCWMRLLSDYYQLINSKEAANYIKNVAKIEGVNIKITQVELLLIALRVSYQPRLISLLRDWGYNLPFTQASLSADLDRVAIELGNDRVKREKYRLEYERQEKAKQKNGEGATKDSFMRMLYALEAHRKMNYDPKEISTYKVVILYNELVEYNNFLKAKNKGNGSR